MRSLTLVNTPRRRRRSVSCLNQPSTRFSHDELVGVKCRCHRARLGWSSQRVDVGTHVRRQVVQDHVDGEVGRDVQVDEPEERQHVLAGVMRPAVVEDLAGGHVHRREQVGSAVPLVVMGHRRRPARLERQARLGPIERLALGLLVEAEHDGPLRRVHVQADDVDQLLLEPLVVRQLEVLDPPRLELIVLPDPRHGVLADPEPGRQRPRRPMRRRVVGRLLAGDPHHLGHRAFGQPRLAAPTRRNPTDPLDALDLEASTPCPHRLRRRLTPASHLVGRHPVARHQQRLGLHDLAMRQRRRAGRPLQRHPLLVGHRQRSSSHHRHADTVTVLAISATDH